MLRRGYHFAGRDDICMQGKSLLARLKVVPVECGTRGGRRDLVTGRCSDFLGKEGQKLSGAPLAWESTLNAPRALCLIVVRSRKTCPRSRAACPIVSGVF